MFSEPKHPDWDNDLGVPADLRHENQPEVDTGRRLRPGLINQLTVRLDGLLRNPTMLD